MSIKLNYNWWCQPITYINSEAELRVNFNFNNFILFKNKNNQLFT